MILCPQCEHREYSGALFCSQCGAQLYESINTTAATTSADIKKALEISSPATPTFPSPPTDAADARAAIQLIDSGEVIFLRGEKEFTLGRSTEGQMVVPDIDLSPFDAYEAGVSRLHTSLTVRGNQVIAKDLGSANGTRLNDERISAHEEHIIRHGDVLSLGKLKIQILIRE
ncbi:MAG: FHA domain-containing protein [Chloroflexi bacterium]|nr:FHA domain-containing protein [Chloroflexota bacterium]